MGVAAFVPSGVYPLRSWGPLHCPSAWLSLIHHLEVQALYQNLGGQKPGESEALADMVDTSHTMLSKLVIF